MDDTSRGDNSFATIVSGLTSLVQHVQAGIKLIDNEVARERTSADTETNNIVVLDDVTSQYLKARHALNSCSASLDAALRSLLEGEAHQSAGEQVRLRCTASRSSCAAK